MGLENLRRCEACHATLKENLYMRASRKGTTWMGALLCFAVIAANVSWASASSLVGKWATSEAFGNVVDAGTGATLRSAYNGEAYHFRKDGTFTYVLVASGTLITGVYTERGEYKVKDNRLYVNPKTKDWAPNPTHGGQQPAYKNRPALPGDARKFEFTFHGNNSVTLLELKTKIKTTLHRGQ